MDKVSKKSIIALIALFIIFSAFVIISKLIDDSDEKFMQELSLHQKIDESQIESIRMGKIVLIDSTFKQIDIELNNEQNQKIITIFNSISPESISSINTINSNIVSGIVIRLKNRSEVRIQYDKKNIFVSRSEVKYSVENNELKEIFDNELKRSDI